MADHSVSYQTLLQQCAQGNSIALQQLYDIEAPYLKALGLSLLHRNNDAEELVRESFGLIWRHASAYDLTLGTARAWIYSIFRFRAQLRLKQMPNRNAFIKVKSRLLIHSNAPTALKQFQHIDEKARTMVALAYLHAYDYAQIAKECSSSIDLTQKSIHQALLKLTHLFDSWQSQSDEELILLGTYCLGLLRDSAHVAPAQNLLNDNRKAAQDLLKWEDILSALAYSLTPQSPAPQLLERIYQDLNLSPAPTIKPSPAATSIQSEPSPALSESLVQIINNPVTAGVRPPSRFDTPDPINHSAQREQHADQKEQELKHVIPPIDAVSAAPPVPELAISNTVSEHIERSDPANASPLHDGNKTKSKWKKKYWIFVFLLGVLGSLGVWAFMPKPPTIQMVKMSPRAGAVLQAPGQSSTPAWILSVDPEGHILLTPQVRTELQADEAVQLWTQAPNSTEIRSLGLLNPNEPVTIPQELIGEVIVGQIFEMTLEPLTGSNEPSGPVLYLGRIVQFGDFKEESTKSDT